MFSSSAFRRLGLFSFALAAAVACSNGGASHPVAPILGPTTNPTASPTSQSAVTTTIALPATPASAMVALPNLGAFQESVVIPAASAPPGTTIAASVSLTLPLGAPPLAHARVPLERAPPPGVTPLLVFTFVASQTITFVGQPGFTIVPSPGTLAAGASVILAYDDPKNGWIVLGPFAQQADGSYLYAGTPQGLTPVTFTAGVPAIFAVYATTSPPVVPVVAPSALVFMGYGDAINATITASEIGYTGNFAATSDDTSVARVAPAISSGTFRVNAAGIGQTVIHVTDQYGASARVTVSIDLPMHPGTPEPSEAPTNAPTPTPGPSATPTATASPTPTATPIFQVSPTDASLYLPATADPRFPSSVSISVHEEDYFGYFFAREDPTAPCTIGSVTYATLDKNEDGPSDGVFTITAQSLRQNGAGIDCAFLVSDETGRSKQVRISIVPALKITGK